MGVPKGGRRTRTSVRIALFVRGVVAALSARFWSSIHTPFTIGRRVEVLMPTIDLNILVCQAVLVILRPDKIGQVAGNDTETHVVAEKASFWSHGGLFMD